MDGEDVAEEGEGGNEGNYNLVSPWFGGLINKKEFNCGAG